MQCCRRRSCAAAMGRTDVVIGLIETHGRQSTEELLEEIELVPRRKVEYRGHVVEEMDIDAVLKRHPDLAVVDELAHSNVPGSRNAKRYLDVRELIESGIDVFTTLNVQHIESLGTTVAKITWSVVRETVPDSMLDLADEIEVVDLSPTDLVRRLDEGKLDGAIHRELAARSFFSDHSLAALRELAFRFAKKRPARSILIPFDGSPSAVRAVQYVIALARAGHRASVFLLNVQPSTTANRPQEAGPVPEIVTAGLAMLGKASQLLEPLHIARLAPSTGAEQAERQLRDRRLALEPADGIG
jgi:osmosensitive K+ channel His kinase sensor protein/universal stress protein family protein